MGKVLGVLLAALLVVSVSAAWAGDIEGKIKQVDPSERALVLDDGTKLWVAEGLAMEGLKEGASVKASYEERDGKNVIVSFEVSD